jgi:hypothetical protein
MHSICRVAFISLVFGAMNLGGVANAGPQKEFLTPKEIAKIQDAQEIEQRIKIYMEAAELRLKSAEDRLSGKEAPEGDPLEFYAVDEMLDGYFRIIRSVMLNLDDVAQKPKTDQGKLTKALKNVKDTTERAAKQLDGLKKQAEDKKLESTWNAVNQAIDINKGALEGATIALSNRPASDTAKPKKRP